MKQLLIIITTATLFFSCQKQTDVLTTGTGGGGSGVSGELPPSDTNKDKEKNQQISYDAGGVHYEYKGPEVSAERVTNFVNPDDPTSQTIFYNFYGYKDANTNFAIYMRYIDSLYLQDYTTIGAEREVLNIRLYIDGQPYENADFLLTVTKYEKGLVSGTFSGNVYLDEHYGENIQVTNGIIKNAKIVYK